MELVQRLLRMTIKDLTNSFVNSCGLHGLNKLHLDEISLSRRIVWFTMILGSMAYLGYTVYMELSAYYTYPTITVIEADQHEVMTFPAVTICNLSPLNKSKQPVNDSRYFDMALSSSSSWRRTVPLINWSDVEYQDEIFQNSIGISDMFSLSMDMNTSITECSFDDAEEKCFQNMQQTLTGVGPCFTFNKDGHIKTKETGTNTNLMLRIYIDKSNYFISFSQGSGIKVIVHEPGATPDVYNDGFVLPPGSLGYAGINKKVYHRRPLPYNRKSPCVDTESSNFRNPNRHSNYSVSSCLRECRYYHAQSLTGCIIPAFNNADPPYCSLSRYKEFNEALQTAMHDDIVAKKCNKRCTVPCKRVEYDVKITYGEYPSQFKADIVKAYINPTHTLSYLRSNYLMLNVFYERLETMYWNQIPYYQTVQDVLANLGGQIGLFLGASVLTLLEILEFCGQIIIHNTCKVKLCGHKVEAKENDEDEVK